jgi:hypothetical protein
MTPAQAIGAAKAPEETEAEAEAEAEDWGQTVNVVMASAEGVEER